MRSSDQSPSSLTLLTVIGLALFLSAVIFFIFDVLYWLKYATWSATKLSDVFRYYGVREPYFVEWRGLQELWSYLRDAPLSLLLLVIWFLFTGVAGSLFGSRIQNDRWSNGPHRGKRR
jgi:hypothetical protein